MKTLNEITQRLDGTNFDSYRLNDLIDSISEMTEEEISGLKERLVELESIFQDLEFDDERIEELFKLRSMFGE